MPQRARTGRGPLGAGRVGPALPGRDHPLGRRRRPGPSPTPHLVLVAGARGLGDHPGRRCLPGPPGPSRTPAALTPRPTPTHTGRTTARLAALRRPAVTPCILGGALRPAPCARLRVCQIYEVDFIHL